MPGLQWLRLMAFAGLLPLVTACANLSAVQDFASLASTTTAYPAAINAYVSSPERQKRWVPEAQAAKLDAIAADRKEQRAALLALQGLATSYMDALGALSADGAYSFAGDVQGLAKTAAGARIVSPASAKRIGFLGGLLDQAITGGWRKAKVAQLIREGNAPFRDVLTQLDFIAQALDADLATEADSIRLAHEFATPDSNRAMQLLLRNSLEDNLARTQARATAISAYRAALAEIGDAHAVLSQSPDKPSAVQVVRRLLKARATLEKLRPQLAMLF
jgi:hypothetical protein